MQNPHNNQSSNNVQIPNEQIVQRKIALRRSEKDRISAIFNNYIVYGDLITFTQVMKCDNLENWFKGTTKELKLMDDNFAARIKTSPM